MNNTRRAQLRKALGMIETAQSIIEEVKEQEQEAYDNLPEGLQESDRGRDIDENAYTLEMTLDEIETIVDSLYEIVER